MTFVGGAEDLSLAAPLEWAAPARLAEFGREYAHERKEEHVRFHDTRQRPFTVAPDVGVLGSARAQLATDLREVPPRSLMLAARPPAGVRLWAGGGAALGALETDVANDFEVRSKAAAAAAAADGAAAARPEEDDDALVRRDHNGAYFATSRAPLVVRAPAAAATPAPAEPAPPAPPKRWPSTSLARDPRRKPNRGARCGVTFGGRAVPCGRCAACGGGVGGNGADFGTAFPLGELRPTFEPREAQIRADLRVLEGGARAAVLVDRGDIDRVKEALKAGSPAAAATRWPSQPGLRRPAQLH